MYMGYCPSVRSKRLDIGQVFSCLLDRDVVELHKLTKRERGQYPAILTIQAWSIKDLLFFSRGKIAPFCPRR